MEHLGFNRHHRSILRTNHNQKLTNMSKPNITPLGDRVLVQSVEDAGRRACRRVGAIRMPGHVRQPDQLIGVDHSREASLQRAESDMAVVSRDDDEPLLIPGQRHTDADPHDHAAFATVVNDKRRDESKTRSRHHSAE